MAEKSGSRSPIAVVVASEKALTAQWGRGDNGKAVRHEAPHKGSKGGPGGCQRGAKVYSGAEGTEHEETCTVQAQAEGE